MEDNTTLYIKQLTEQTQTEIFLTLQERLLTEDSEIDSYDVNDMMNFRLCDIYDNEAVMFEEVLKWSNNKSIK